MTPFHYLNFFWKAPAHNTYNSVKNYKAAPTVQTINQEKNFFFYSDKLYYYIPVVHKFISQIHQSHFISHLITKGTLTLSTVA